MDGQAADPGAIGGDDGQHVEAWTGNSVGDQRKARIPSLSLSEFPLGIVTPAECP